MSNITVSSAVDNMLQSANNSAIRTSIGAIAPDFSGAFTGDLEFQDGEILFNEGFSVEDGDIELSSSGQTIILNGNDIGGAGSITTNDLTVNGNTEFNDEIVIEGDVDATNAGSFEVNDFSVNGSAEFQDSVEFSGGDVEFTAGGGQSLIMSGSSISGAVSVNADRLELNPITTTQRNALSASNGMIIYNTSTSKFQGRANGVWVDLH